MRRRPPNNAAKLTGTRVPGATSKQERKGCAPTGISQRGHKRGFPPMRAQARKDRPLHPRGERPPDTGSENSRRPEPTRRRREHKAPRAPAGSDARRSQPRAPARAAGPAGPQPWPVPPSGRPASEGWTRRSSGHARQLTSRRASRHAARPANAAACPANAPTCTAGVHAPVPSGPLSMWEIVRAWRAAGKPTARRFYAMTPMP